jgi:hypothetical protein
MSKKHFIELAEIIRVNSNPKLHGDEARQAVAQVAQDLADFCKRQNSNFDRARFLEACNVKHAA